MERQHHEQLLEHTTPRSSSGAPSPEEPHTMSHGNSFSSPWPRLESTDQHGATRSVENVSEHEVADELSEELKRFVEEFGLRGQLGGGGGGGGGMNNGAVNNGPPTSPMFSAGEQTFGVGVESPSNASPGDIANFCFDTANILQAHNKGAVHASFGQNHGVVGGGTSPLCCNKVKCPLSGSSSMIHGILSPVLPSSNSPPPSYPPSLPPGLLDPLS